MTYAIIKSRNGLGRRHYRVVELMQSREGREFGLTVNESGNAGWATYSSKAKAFKAARKIVKASIVPQILTGQLYEETPFAPMTSQLRKII